MDTLQFTKRFVEDLFKNNHNKHLHYHSLEHTQAVVKQCQKAAIDLNLTDDQSLILVTAAWLHDIGYLFTYEKHEAESIRLAISFLKAIHFEYRGEVITCIAATEIGIEPKHELAALLKDIDAAYGFYTNFKEKGKLLRQEWALTNLLTFTDMEWTNVQRRFLKNFQWFTDYGKQNFQKIIEEWVYKINQKW